MPAHKKPALDDTVGQLQELPRRVVRLLAKAADLEDKVATRFIRRFRKEGRDWTPSARFSAAIHQYVTSVVKLSRELREIAEANDASELSDADLKRALEDAVYEEIKTMPSSTLERILAEDGHFDDDAGNAH